MPHDYGFGPHPKDVAKREAALLKARREREIADATAAKDARIEELERNLADLQESVKAQHLRDFGVTGDPELPPGYELVRIFRIGDDYEWWGIDRGGIRIQGRFGMQSSAIAWAWEDFPIPRERYQKLQACERAMDAVDNLDVEVEPGTHALWAAARSRHIDEEWHQRDSMLDAITDCLDAEPACDFDEAASGAVIDALEDPAEAPNEPKPTEPRAPSQADAHHPELPAGWEDWPIKRAAWAYGCAKKGSDDEGVLLTVLLAIARDEAGEANIPAESTVTMPDSGTVTCRACGESWEQGPTDDGLIHHGCGDRPVAKTEKGGRDDG